MNKLTLRFIVLVMLLLSFAAVGQAEKTDLTVDQPKIAAENQVEANKPKKMTRAERKAAKQLEAARKAEEKQRLAQEAAQKLAEEARRAEEEKAQQEALAKEMLRRAVLEELLKTPVELDLTCRKAILVDGKSGQVIYNKNGDDPWHPASTTKIMSALMILENGKLEDTTTVSYSATDLYGGYYSNWLWAGMQFTVDQLLHILLIESDNASCNTLAEYLDGTQEKFVERMNKRAKEMGLSAHFTTPYGHTNDNHYVSARDLYLIAKACMEYPAFREIVSTVRYHLSARDIDVTYRNRNQLLGVDPRVLGIKTGYTSAARCNLVLYAEEGEDSLYSVVMGSPRGEIDYSYPDSKKLLDYGFKLLKEARAAGK